jgi:hypothetical protein
MCVCVCVCARARVCIISNYLGLFALGDFLLLHLLSRFHADSEVLPLVGDGWTGAFQLRTASNGR